MDLEKLKLLVTHSDTLGCIITAKCEERESHYDEDKMLKEVHKEIMELVGEKEEEKTSTTNTKEPSFSNEDIPF